MDLELRLKALGRLADSHTAAAEEALKSELQKTIASLPTATRFDQLEQHLSVLEVIGHRFSKTVVDEVLRFIADISARRLTYSEEAATYFRDIEKYQNASTLIVRAIEVLIRFRYLETKTIVTALLKASRHEAESVRDKAMEGLKSIARYNIQVFYGDDTQQGVGAFPQMEAVQVLEALPNPELLEYQAAVLALADGLLSPTIEGTRWTYKSLTISRGATPAKGGVAEVRHATIELLKRVYALATGVRDKLSVIGVMNHATRRHDVRIGDDVVEMASENTRTVLAFYESLVTSGVEFQIVQKIESQSYWIFYHAGDKRVREAALAIEKAIANNAEYQIYKTLIGFEGTFGAWETLRKADGYWEETDKVRKAKAAELAASIDPTTYELWRGRILAYATTESDDLATFPIFYEFLESFARAQPKLALRLISEHAEQIERFLIPLLRGIWSGAERETLRKVIEGWIGKGRYLYAATKQFLDNPALDRALVVRILERAAELKELDTVALVMSVAATNYQDDKSIVEDLFLPALRILTEHESAQWVFDLWFRREARQVIRQLDGNGTALVLRNMLALDKIDYHAEEILFLVAQSSPEKVLEFLCQRLNRERKTDEKKGRSYEAVPYAMHKLHEPLSKIPEQAVRMLRGQFDVDAALFTLHGGRLLKTIFPQFSPDFEAALLKIVEEGKEADLDFVLAVLRNYEGQPFIHAVCKAVVKSMPSTPQYRTEVAIALQNTGVVTGEFGFSEAYEAKKLEIQGWMEDPNEKVREFARWYIDGLEQMIVADRKRAEEDIALRKHRYGE